MEIEIKNGEHKVTVRGFPGQYDIHSDGTYQGTRRKLAFAVSEALRLAGLTQD